MSQETVVPQELLRRFNGTLVYRGRFDDFISRGEHFVIHEDASLFRNGIELVYYGEGYSWSSDTQGDVFIQLDGRLLRNGKDTIYEGVLDRWAPDGWGNVIIRLNNRFLRNGTELIYQGKCDAWTSDAQGNVIIWLGNRLLRNGTELIYEGVWDEWWTYRNGIMVQYDEKDGTKSLVYYNPFDHMASPFDD